MGDLADDICLDFMGQGAENFRRLPGRQIGQDQGNRLSLLILNDVQI
jgi:hypothetical protein